MKTLPRLMLLALLLLVARTSAAAEDIPDFKEHLEKANELIRSYRHFEAAEVLQEAAALAGDRHPSVHMRLGILYYGLGLIPEAIAEGQKAVNLAPSSKWYKYDLAKFYYVDKQYAKAEEQFIDLLTQDPGFTLGYSYLAELYFRNKNYDMAWLSLQRARLLGHQGKNLEDKLAAHTSKPSENFLALAPEQALFRYIKLPSEQEAKNALAEIAGGKLFENLELELKKDKSGDIEFGSLGINEFNDPRAAETLLNQVPFASPTMVTSSGVVRIVQRIAPFDIKAWRALTTTPATRREKAGSGPMVPAGQHAAITASTPPLTRPSPSVSTTSPEPTTTSQELPARSNELPVPPPGYAQSDKALQHLSLQLEAFYALEAWKNAWQAADIEAYLAAYSEQFVPASQSSREAWRTQRIAGLTRPKYIHLKVDNPVVDLQADDRLQITFTQYFQSDNYHDAVRKALVMVREKGCWKISEERILKVLEE